jgi:NADPH:quinone reductase-like Zn-dependent oxidoreductase
VIAYDEESVLDRPARYHIVYDTLGGATTLASFRVLERGGTVVSIAGPPDAKMADAVGASPIVRLAMWLMRRKVEAAARRADARYFRFLTESRGDQLRGIAELVDAGRIHAVLDSTVPFADASAAFARVASGRAQGKVVLTMA